MKNQKWFTLVIALLLIAGTAYALTWLRTNQKLGTPGIRGTLIPNSIALKIDLPERVLDFTSTNLPEPEEVIAYLPADTSYASRIYFAPDGLMIQSSVILMGADRTSIHRPEYCLPGHGWNIDEKKVVELPIDDQPPYKLEAAKWNVSTTVQQPDGQKVNVGGIYVFWFVADNEETMNHDKMLEWLTLDLFRTHALQRWAYISYFAECRQGQEDATFDQMKSLIAASVPKFQLPLKQN
jgi:hypothetical protein